MTTSDYSVCYVCIARLLSVNEGVLCTSVDYSLNRHLVSMMLHILQRRNNLNKAFSGYLVGDCLCYIGEKIWSVMKNLIFLTISQQVTRFRSWIFNYNSTGCYRR